jgi:hypothetical protein
MGQGSFTCVVDLIIVDELSAGVVLGKDGLGYYQKYLLFDHAKLDNIEIRPRTINLRSCNGLLYCVPAPQGVNRRLATSGVVVQLMELERRKFCSMYQVLNYNE